MVCPLCRSTWLVQSPDAVICCECGALFARRVERRAPEPRRVPRVWNPLDFVRLRRAVEAIEVRAA